LAIDFLVGKWMGNVAEKRSFHGDVTQEHFFYKHLINETFIVFGKPFSCNVAGFDDMIFWVAVERSELGLKGM